MKIYRRDMPEFTLEAPTKIYFGNDCTESAVRAENRWIQGAVLVVTTGRSLKRLGYVGRLVEILESMPSVERVVVFDEISANPKLTEVERAVLAGKENGVQCVVGFGGGSALDAAKAAAVGIGTGIPVGRYLLEGIEPGEETLPVIAIPTTAGTGSELSKGAIISSPQHRLKSGIRGRYLFPKAAIVDPVYTWTVPRRITMETGFDVLAHAIESYVAQKANLFSEMLSEKAVRIAASNLQVLSRDLDHRPAREQMSLASMLMGMNLASVGTCLPHRMQYPVGALTDTSHGSGLAALYPYWIAREYEVKPIKIQWILSQLGNDTIQNSEDAKRCMEMFLKRLQLDFSLTGLGITEDDIPALAAAVTGNLVNDILGEKSGIVTEIFEESLRNQ